MNSEYYKAFSKTNNDLKWSAELEAAVSNLLVNYYQFT